MAIYLLALSCVVAAAMCGWLAMRPAQARPDRTPRAANGRSESTASVVPSTAAPARSVRAEGSRPGWLRVLPVDELLQLVHADSTLDHLRRQSRLTPAVWQRDLLPAIHRYAAFVQLMPASESHHHAHAGGLLAHTLETLLAALTWRNGRLLPQGAHAEAADAQRDFWTYAVFFAALLHDVGKPMTDLRIDWLRPKASDPVRWMPAAGALEDCGAEQYRVGFAPKAERDYAAHGRLGAILPQRLAPTTALSFMGREPQTLQALTRYLSGEDRDGPVAEIVSRADRASTVRALSQGSRARFSSAVSVPLIELLMGALRDLLRRGGQLPLNRNGASGWVYDGSLWFVAKRLADQLRDHVKQHAPDEPIPGDTKNDRLFDTLQEYGCVTLNPASQQAIWYVVVHGEDGDCYSHRLTMLRFPLDKLWDDPSQYPAPMTGRIEVLASREAEAAGAQTLPQPGRDAAAAPTRVAGTDAAAPTGIPAPCAAATSPQTPKAAAAPSVRAPNLTPRAARARAKDPESIGGSAFAAAPASSAPAVESEFFDATDTALVESRRKPIVTSYAPAASAAADGLPGELSGPVALIPQLPAVPGTAAEKPAPEVAIQFMLWLMTGLRDRGITYNETGAPVHFVPAGMALVSPLIFREFARHRPDIVAGSEPDRAGLDVQREVLKAGWHVAGPAGKNIHHFTVVKRGGIKAGRLSAVVLAEPHRFVVPVPPPNPAIVMAENEKT